MFNKDKKMKKGLFLLSLSALFLLPSFTPSEQIINPIAKILAVDVYFDNATDLIKMTGRFEADPKTIIQVTINRLDEVVHPDRPNSFSETKIREPVEFLNELKSKRIWDFTFYFEIAELKTNPIFSTLEVVISGQKISKTPLLFPPEIDSIATINSSYFLRNVEQIAVLETDNNILKCPIYHFDPTFRDVRIENEEIKAYGFENLQANLYDYGLDFRKIKFNASHATGDVFDAQIFFEDIHNLFPRFLKGRESEVSLPLQLRRNPNQSFSLFFKNEYYIAPNSGEFKMRIASSVKTNYLIFPYAAKEKIKDYQINLTIYNFGLVCKEARLAFDFTNVRPTFDTIGNAEYNFSLGLSDNSFPSFESTVVTYA